MNARETVEQFFDLLCKEGVEVSEFEEMIQSSYREQQKKSSDKVDRSIYWNAVEQKYLSSKDRSKIINLQGWQQAVQTLLNKLPKSYRIISENEIGLNMIQFCIQIPTRYMLVLYSTPNVIRENGVWQINPISALPQKTNKKRHQKQKKQKRRRR